MRIAFKEWAIVVDALALGEQIIILRKGGISESRSGFRIEHPAFLLFPTLFHQQRDSVIAPAQRRYDEISARFPKPHRLKIEHYAEIVDWRELTSLQEAQALRSQHIWRDEVIADRFEWGHKKDIYAMAVRVFRLAEARELPVLPSYGGCKSWIALEEEFVTTDATPILRDDANK